MSTLFSSARVTTSCSESGSAGRPSGVFAGPWAGGGAGAGAGSWPETAPGATSTSASRRRICRDILKRPPTNYRRGFTRPGSGIIADGSGAPPAVHLNQTQLRREKIPFRLAKRERAFKKTARWPVQAARGPYNALDPEAPDMKVLLTHAQIQ